MIHSKDHKNFQNVSFHHQSRFKISESLPATRRYFHCWVTSWKGHLALKEYLPLKSSQFVIKTFKLCESSSGYLSSITWYIRRETVLEFPLISNATPKTTAVILKLSEPLLHNSYTLWLGNYYTSPNFQKFLNPCNMDRMGTMKIYKKNVPKKEREKMTRGSGYCPSGWSCLCLQVEWQGQCNMISSYHGTEVRP
jgi:hypothetical protein